jgi:hypothetical protein
MQRRGVGVEQGADDVSGIEVRSGLVGAEQSEVVVGKPEPSLMAINLLALSGQLCSVSGKANGSPLGEMAVEALPFRHAPYLVDRVEQLGEKAASSIVTGDLLVTIRAGSKLTDTPPTVAPGCAEADDLLLDHDYPQ